MKSRARQLFTRKIFTGKEFTRLEEAAAIVENKFIVGDSLKIMKQWAAPQQELF